MEISITHIRRKFPWESDSERVLKIGLQLPKSLPKFECFVFKSQYRMVNNTNTVAYSTVNINHFCLDFQNGDNN